MAKEIARTVSGELQVANNVFADIAGYTALECYGVVGMAAPNLQDGIAKLLPKDRLRRGILVSSDEDGVSLDLYIIIEQGTNLTTVSENLADRIRFVMSEYAQVPIKDVTIHVQGVHIHR